MLYFTPPRPQGVDDDDDEEGPKGSGADVSAAADDDDLGDPDVLADVMADPEFLQQVCGLIGCPFFRL